MSAADVSDAAVTPRLGLVRFCFGAARVGPDGDLAGPVLVHMLGDLGLSGSAARSVLLRMRQHGLLESSRVGREARYRLAPALDVAQARLARQLSGRRPAWSGYFNGILYEIPERHRAFRDRLRRSAQLLGYVTLRPGMAIATSDRWDELLSLLPPRPQDSQLLRTRLTFSESDSRRLARDLWDLEAVASRYRRVIANARLLTTDAERRPPSGRAAFQAFSAALAPVYSAIADDPDLPEELLPDDWPSYELRVMTSRALRVFGPLLDEYLRSVTNEHDDGDPTEPDELA